MDIFKYFESADVANYCKRIGYEFSALEMVYIIDVSHNKIDKAEDLAYLLDSYPDMSIKKYTPNYNGVLGKKGRPKRCLNSGFDRVDTLHEYIAEAIKIEKGESEKYDGCQLFGEYLPLPIPFRKGDLVEYRNQAYLFYGVADDWGGKVANNDFVDDKIADELDIFFMSSYSYYYEKKSNLVRLSETKYPVDREEIRVVNPINLIYRRKKLTGKDSLLADVSHYIKNEINSLEMVDRIDSSEVQLTHNALAGIFIDLYRRWRDITDCDVCFNKEWVRNELEALKL